MNVERIFLDANILVYAHDRNEPAKRAVAAQILKACWASPVPPSLSVQVLQEAHVTLLRKGVALNDSIETVTEFLQWNVIENRTSLFREALSLQKEFQLSFWDSSILAAALASGAEELWSEDFQPNRTYREIVVKNPFLE